MVNAEDHSFSMILAATTDPLSTYSQRLGRWGRNLSALSLPPCHLVTWKVHSHSHPASSFMCRAAVTNRGDRPLMPASGSRIFRVGRHHAPCTSHCNKFAVSLWHMFEKNEGVPGLRSTTVQRKSSTRLAYNTWSTFEGFPALYESDRPSATCPFLFPLPTCM